MDKRLYAPLKDGKKAPLPRYYKEKIYNSEQAGWLKGVMEKLGMEQQKKLEKIHKENLPFKLSQSHMSQFKKMYKNATAGTKL